MHAGDCASGGPHWKIHPDYKIGVDPAVEGGDSCTVQFYTVYDGGGVRPLTEEELKDAIFAYSEEAAENRAVWERHEREGLSYYTGTQWGITFPKENNNG